MLKGKSTDFDSTCHWASAFDKCKKKSRICTRPSSFDTHLGEWASGNFQPWSTGIQLNQIHLMPFHLYCLQKAKVEELQTIIRQSAKERLWLERQISNGDSSRTPSPQVLAGDLAAEIKKKTERLYMLEDENNNLKSSVEQLQKAEAESLKLVRLMGSTNSLV